MATARQSWRAAQPTLEVSRLVFVDESGFMTNMTRRFGRAPRGQRLVARVPYGHWQTLTFVGALRSTGLTAPLVLDGPMDAVSFECYVEQILGPTLHAGDLVIMDNLAAHKRPAIAQRLRRFGATRLLLPPYSPDLNPIEQVFAKLKALVRQAEKRSLAALWEFIGHALARFSPRECQQYLHHCGYIE